LFPFCFRLSLSSVACLIGDLRCTTRNIVDATASIDPWHLQKVVNNNNNKDNIYSAVIVPPGGRTARVHSDHAMTHATAPGGRQLN
jgi:hypothetical protein